MSRGKKKVAVSGRKSRSAAEEPLISKNALLEKFPGKGGWTYARVPEIPQHKNNPFGWVRVKGSIDGVPLSKYHLMPMGNGQLFLPVKAEIRKKIGKQAGDFIKVILYLDADPIEIPEEMLSCLKDEPFAFDFFNSLEEGEKKQFVDWVYSAKKEETKVERLARTINLLASRKKFRSPDRSAT